MRLRLGHTARRIDVADQTVTATADTGDEQVFGYDALIVGTGAAPVVPSIDASTSSAPSTGCICCTPSATPTPSPPPSTAGREAR